MSVKNVLLVFFLLASKNLLSGVYGKFPKIGKLQSDHSIKEISIQEIETMIKFLSYDSQPCNDFYHGDFKYIPDADRDKLISVTDLATSIHEISKCFKIDAAMYAVQLYRESNLCYFGGKNQKKKKMLDITQARLSSTNAKGISMFTSIALAEVKDQLFISDTDYYHYKARPILHQYLAECSLAGSFKTESAKEYLREKIWSKDDKYLENKYEKTYDLGKPENWEGQVAYGAILMKINLSANSISAYSSANHTHYYKHALKEYNNSEHEKEDYWRDIFCLYENLVDESWYSTSNEQGNNYEVDIIDEETKKVIGKKKLCTKNLEYIQIRKDQKS